MKAARPDGAGCFDKGLPDVRFSAAERGRMGCSQ